MEPDEPTPTPGSPEPAVPEPVASDGGIAADEVVPVVRAPRPAGPVRHRGRWVGAAAVLAVLGVGAVVAALLVDTDVAVADGAPPAQRAGTPVLSARRVPEWVARPVAARNLQAAVAPVIARAPADSCVAVNDGATPLVASRVTSPLAPASNMKLLTTSAALDLLGPDTRLTTTVQAAAPPTAGTVTGDLFLVGGGDPVLSTATASTRMTNGPQPVTSLEALADKVAAAGVRQVTGSVVGDGTRYDAQRSVAGWPARFVGQGLVANLGALVVNDAWTLDPVNPAGAKGAPAADPAAHAAAVFTVLLQARGVQVAAPPRSGQAPAGATTIAEQPSLTIRELVDETLAFSDNTSAELLLKELGHAKGGAGSTQAGTDVVRSWLTSQQLPTDGVVLVDGSGLSDANRVTCTLLSAVLQRGGPDGLLAAGLARPGRPGTLEDRLTGPDLKDRVRAKTGTLQNVTALSGWTTTAAGKPLQFSVVENTGTRPVQAADLAVQGDLLQALLPYPQTPPLDQLLPRPPVSATG